MALGCRRSEICPSSVLKRGAEALFPQINDIYDYRVAYFFMVRKGIGVTLSVKLYSQGTQQESHSQNSQAITKTQPSQIDACTP